MAESKTAPRAYGMPDPANRQPTPEQGLRGEQEAPSARSADGLPRRIDGGGGRLIAVAEQSGVAWAEATGATSPADAAASARSTGSRVSVNVPLLATAAVVGAAAAGLMIAAAGRFRRGDHAARKGARPAFRQACPDQENFSQIRDAGPEHIRDISEREWDRTDESSDESFPASDPPATY